MDCQNLEHRPDALATAVAVIRVLPSADADGYRVCAQHLRDYVSDVFLANGEPVAFLVEPVR